MMRTLHASWKFVDTYFKKAETFETWFKTHCLLSRPQSHKARLLVEVSCDTCALKIVNLVRMYGDLDKLQTYTWHELAEMYKQLERENHGSV